MKEEEGVVGKLSRLHDGTAAGLLLSWRKAKGEAERIRT